MNIKKVGLLTLFVLTIFTLPMHAKGLSAVGVKFEPGVSNHGFNWGLGATLGLGEMRGNPYFINLFLGYFHHELSITPQFDWHTFVKNLGPTQLYLGFGVGATLGFCADGYWEKPFTFSVGGRVPIGFKFFFLEHFELGLELTPQLGFYHHSHRVRTVDPDKDARTSDNGIYLNGNFALAFRYWF